VILSRLRRYLNQDWTVAGAIFDGRPGRVYNFTMVGGFKTYLFKSKDPFILYLGDIVLILAAD